MLKESFSSQKKNLISKNPEEKTNLMSLAEIPASEAVLVAIYSLWHQSEDKDLLFDNPGILHCLMDLLECFGSLLYSRAPFCFSFYFLQMVQDFPLKLPDSC